MANPTAHQPTAPDDSASEDKGGLPDGNASNGPPPEDAGGEHPRLIEEHHVVGPDGQDQIEATDERGRRWYHLRPEPRSRYDFIGFNFTWWLIWVFFILIIFVPWGRGWGY